MKVTIEKYRRDEEFAITINGETKECTLFDGCVKDLEFKDQSPNSKRYDLEERKTIALEKSADALKGSDLIRGIVSTKEGITFETGTSIVRINNNTNAKIKELEDKVKELQDSLHMVIDKLNNNIRSQVNPLENPFVKTNYK
ncbi:MAG: hypothetical protein K0U41_08490 [Gammaproteobacteria bacterium]|nr:hypothetical protein [Gammaproteobacteria bacterium]